MNELERKAKLAAVQRINEATHADIRLKARGPSLLPDGQRVWFRYARGHDQGHGKLTFWMGQPVRALPQDWIVMVLRTEHQGMRADSVDAVKDAMTHSGDGRPTPYIVAVDGHFEYRIPSQGIVVDLDESKPAYDVLG